MKNLIFSFWSLIFILPLLTTMVLQFLKPSATNVATDAMIFMFFSIFFPVIGYYLSRYNEDFETAMFSRFRTNLCSILCGLTFIFVFSAGIALVCALKLIITASGTVLFFQITLRAFFFAFIYSFFEFCVGYLCGMIPNTVISSISVTVLTIVLHPYVLCVWLLPENISTFTPAYYLADILYFYDVRNANTVYMMGGYDIRVVLKSLAVLLPALGLLTLAVYLRSKANKAKLLSIGAAVLSFVLVIPIFKAFNAFEIKGYSEDNFFYTPDNPTITADGAELTQYKFMPSPEAQKAHDISAESCYIETNISDTYSARCTVTIRNNGSSEYSDKLCFRFDDELYINSFTVNSEKTSFEKTNQNYIKTDKITLAPGESAELFFRYSGIVRYVSCVIQPTASCISNSCCLPSDYPWYPMLITDSDKACDFTLKPGTSNTVVTNLSYDEEKEAYCGNKESIFLFVGYLDEAEINGLKVYYYPEFKAKIESTIERCLPYNCFTEPLTAVYYTVDGCGERIPLKEVLESGNITQIVFVPCTVNGGVDGIYADDNTVIAGEDLL